MMNLNDVLRKEVLRKYKSNKSDTMKKKKEDRNEDTFENAALKSENVKLTFVKKMLSESKKRKKNDEMLIMSKTFCSIDYNNLLMNIEVFKFQKIRNDLRRLVQNYLHVELNLLKMNYQSN